MCTLTKYIQSILWASVLCFMSSVSFSQSLIKNNNDTLVCFTQDEAKSLLKEIYQKQYLDSLNQINTKLIKEYKYSLATLDSICVYRQQQINIKVTTLKLKELRIQTLENDLKASDRQFKRQKRQKIVAILVGSLTTLGVGYLWLTK